MAPEAQSKDTSGMEDRTATSEEGALHESSHSSALKETATYVQPCLSPALFVERLRLKLGRLPCFDACLAAAQVLEDEYADVASRKLADRFKEAFFVHEHVQQMLSGQRWIIRSIAQSIDDLLDPDREPADILIGTDGFRGKLIGGGGFGQVYEVVYGGREGVVKVFSPKGVEQNEIPEAMQRFLDEIAALKTIDGQGTPKLYADGYINPHQPFFISQRIHGWSLQEIMDYAGGCQCDPQFAYRVVAFIGKILHAIHGKGIWHRDVKPENIMIDHSCRVWIIDWGLRGALFHEGVRRTRSGQAMGSAPYMSPEQIDDPKNVGPKTDAYALFCILYELLTGHVPFPGNNHLEILQKQKKELPDESRIPPEARRLIRKWSAKDPAARALVYDGLLELVDLMSDERFPDCPALCNAPHETLTLGGILEGRDDPDAVQKGSMIVASPKSVFQHLNPQRRDSSFTTTMDYKALPDGRLLPAWLHKALRTTRGKVAAATLSLTGFAAAGGGYWYWSAAGTSGDGKGNGKTQPSLVTNGLDTSQSTIKKNGAKDNGVVKDDGKDRKILVPHAPQHFFFSKEDGLRIVLDGKEFLHHSMAADIVGLLSEGRAKEQPDVYFGFMSMQKHLPTLVEKFWPNIPQEDVPQGNQTGNLIYYIIPHSREPAYLLYIKDLGVVYLDRGQMPREKYVLHRDLAKPEHDDVRSALPSLRKINGCCVEGHPRSPAPGREETYYRSINNNINKLLRAAGLLPVPQ